MNKNTPAVVAIIALIDEDSSVAFGTAGGNALTPPEKEYGTAYFSITIDAEHFTELSPKLGSEVEIDEEHDNPNVSLKNGKITITLNLIGKEPFSSTGATYDHISFR